MKQRIDWVDTAKGLTIIGTIVSHCVEWGSFIRNFLFSFHMPLFFLLSGYTTRPVDNKKDLLLKTKKDFKKLIIPALVVAIIKTGYVFFSSHSFSVDALLMAGKDLLKCLFWSSGVTVHNSPALGAVWFLVSIFTARLLFNVINIVFKEDKNKIICILLGMFGIIIGEHGYYLPLNFDVSLVALLFITIGYLFRQVQEKVSKYSLYLIITSVFIWINLVMQGSYIELATRFYDNGLLTTLEALCGTYIVCWLSAALCKKVVLKKIINFLGINSLIILCVHSLDTLFSFVWDRGSNYIRIPLRIVSVLVISLVIIAIKNFTAKRKERNSKQLECLIVSTLLCK